MASFKLALGLIGLSGLSGLSGSAVFGCGEDTESAAKPRGGGGYAVEILDAPEPLTSNPSDRLFSVKLTKGAGLDVKELGVTVQLPSQTKNGFSDLALEDKNGNGTLEVGETFVVREGSANLYSEIHASQSAAVAILRFAKADPKSGVELASGTWNTK